MTSIRLLILASIFISCTTWAVYAPENKGSSNNPKRNINHAPCPGNCYCSIIALICDFSIQANGSAIKVQTSVSILSFSQWTLTEANDIFFENITELRWLRLSRGRLVTFPSVAGLHRLTYLDVSENYITSIPPLTFSNNLYLTQLNVSGNNLTYISGSSFSGLHHLIELDISRNPSLLQIPSNIFSSCCGNLRSLNLSFSGLSTILTDWTSPLQKLIFLNVSHNALTTVPQLSLPSLKIFDASYNQITTLPKLSGLEDLKELYLSHTLICYLNSEETRGCNKLQIIDISYANLTNINENVLSNCKHFKEINLSHNNNLYRIEHGALSGLINLSVLRLNNCPELNDMEDDMFNGLTSLKELHLQESGISVLPSSLGSLHNLPYVNLEGTNLLCDCYAHWLPLLLNYKTNISSWKGINPIQCKDGSTKTLFELNMHLEELSCDGVSSYTEQNQWVLASWDQSALLECNVTGNPQPKIVWQTVNLDLLVYNKSLVDEHPWLNHHTREVLSFAKAPTEGKYQVLQSGQLLIRNMKRKDVGRYKCYAFNAVSNTSVVTFLGLQDTEFRSLILESLLVGFACAAIFLFITLLTQFIKFVMERLGLECCCCCCKDRLSPKAKQIKQLIESVEAYKSAQLDRLKDNYNSQVTSIKDGCYYQMEKIRDSYSHQSKNLKDLCDYSTQQITGAKDQYIEQVNKCRDYSMSQMNRVRENYVFQRQRIRKFSGHQLLRLRETYKYQQKTLNKLLETLPDLYIQNCRTGSCQRTDSFVFEDEIDGLDIYYKVDFLLDTQSFNSSDYYTPSSTLTRSSRSKSKKVDHSHNGSNISGGTEYQEACSWIFRQGSTRSDKIVPMQHKRFHTRSFSLAEPPLEVHCSASKGSEQQKFIKGHKRSNSASSHPSQVQFSPKPPLVEEQQTNSPPRSPSIKSSQGTPLYTPLTLTPVHEQLPMISTLPNCEISVNTTSLQLSKCESNANYVNEFNVSSKSEIENELPQVATH